MQTDPPKRQRLHSPILGGGGGASDDNFDDDSSSSSFQRSRGNSQSTGGQTGGQKATGGRGLRSPLLGAVDGDDMDEPDPAPRGKGGFGAFGHGSKQKKTEFPHRHHDEDDHGDISNQGHAPQAATGGQKNTAQRGGLRSPLLGGGSGDGDYAGGYDDQHDNRSDNRSGRPSKPGRLRSPILGGSGGDDYQDEIFDDEVEEINDPTVLRSPLLATRTPKAHTGANTGVNMGAQAPAQIPVGGPKAAPFVQGPYTQASAGSAPSFSLQSPPLPAPQSGMSNVPAAPTQPPAYTPPPAPPAPIPAAPAMPAPMQNPSSLAANPEYAYGVNPRSSAQSAGTDYSSDMSTAPSGFLAAPVSASSSTNSNMAPMAPMAPSLPTPGPAPQAKSAPSAPAPDNFDGGDESVPKARGMRGSKLLGGDVSDDPAGPLDRRSRFADRRGTPSRNDRRTGYSATDGDDDMESVGKGGFSGHSAAAPNPMAPIAMALAVVALLAKGYYIMAYISNPAFFTTMLPASIDQICTLLFLVGFILFALKASQKS